MESFAKSIQLLKPPRRLYDLITDRVFIALVLGRNSRTRS